MYHIKRLLCIALMLMAMNMATQGAGFNAKEVVLEHIQDSHDWHITNYVNADGEEVPLAIPLPVIVHSSTGWHLFSSSEFEHHSNAD